MQRIPSLDGLRAISITLVILGHLIRWKHVSAEIVGSYGSIGVHVFFVLSGYLITNLLLPEYERNSTIRLRDFYLRRAFRIFPAAFVFLGVVIPLYWQQMSWSHIAAALFYVANMDIARPWIFGHLWSLSIEEQFYLLWPFVLKKWHRHRITILLCVFLGTPVFRTALYALHAKNGLVGSLPVFADQLAIGCLLAILAPRLPKIKPALAGAMVAAVVLIPWFPATSPARTLFALFVLRPILHLSIAGIVWHVIQIPYRALNWAPIVWLGKISYSLYLWQELFCSNATLHGGFVLVVPALACAALSYYLVEQPMLRLRERHSRKPGPALSPALPSASLPLAPNKVDRGITPRSASPPSRHCRLRAVVKERRLSMLGSELQVACPPNGPGRGWFVVKLRPLAQRIAHSPVSSSGHPAHGGLCDCASSAHCAAKIPALRHLLPMLLFPAVTDPTFNNPTSQFGAAE